MLALIAAVSLAQAPIALVQSSNFGVPPKRAAELTRELGQLIRLQGMVPAEARAPCDTHACLISAAKELKATAVVSMGFAMVVKDTLVDIEVLQTSDEKSLGRATFKIPAGGSYPAVEATRFLVALKAALPAPVQDALKPAPVQDALKPAPPPSPVLVPEPTPEPPPPEVIAPVAASSGPTLLPAILTGVGALASGAISLVYLGMGGNKASVQGAYIGMNHLSLTRSAATELLGPANRDYTVSAVCGEIAGGLAVLAVILFVLAQP